MGDDVDIRILELLESRRPLGWSEFELLEALAKLEIDGFERVQKGGTLGLFLRHHHLFHRLYALRDRLRAQGRQDLEIHCLDIRLIPNRPGEGVLPALRDALRDHYGDLSQLDGVDEEAAQAMIDEGFSYIARRRQRSQALSVLGLSDPVSTDQVRRRFHQLALDAHPDRGGDLARFQELSAAAAALR